MKHIGVCEVNRIDIFLYFHIKMSIRQSSLETPTQARCKRQANSVYKSQCPSVVVCCCAIQLPWDQPLEASTSTQS